MPSIYDLFPERWLKAAHLQGRQVLAAIASVAVEELHNPRTNRREPKLIVAFAGKQKSLVLNKTQARQLTAITGSDDYTTWIGHTVTLAPAIAPNGQPTIQILPPA